MAADKVTITYTASTRRMLATGGTLNVAVETKNAADATAVENTASGAGFQAAIQARIQAIPGLSAVTAQPATGVAAVDKPADQTPADNAGGDNAGGDNKAEPAATQAAATSSASALFVGAIGFLELVW